MPVMDGIEATRRIRSSTSEAFDSRIPIIAMTAHAQASDREGCIAAGMNDYVSKPVDRAKLTDAILRWIPQPPENAAALLSEQTPSAMPQPPLPEVFDRAGFRSRLMDDEELMHEVTCEFLKDMPDQIAGLRDLAAHNDAHGAGLKAHLIKGAASNVGGEALRAVAFAIEKAGKAGDLPAITSKIEELEFQFERLRRAMTD
jgi:HPt (histidine-containing phosphotransfer) domain-containing protein